MSCEPIFFHFGDKFPGKGWGMGGIVTRRSCVQELPITKKKKNLSSWKIFYILTSSRLLVSLRFELLHASMARNIQVCFFLSFFFFYCNSFGGGGGGVGCARGV